MLFSYSSENGYINIIKSLLKYKRVDPSDSFNSAIRCAFKYNINSIIDLLWNDSRVKKTLQNDSIY